MHYKYSSFAHKVTQSEAFAAYQPQALVRLPKDALNPVRMPKPVLAEPKPGGLIGLFQRPNRIKYYQSIFEKTKFPVHIAGGRKDVIVYRTVMTGSLIAVGFCFYSMYLMDTGKMKKKKR